MERIVECHKMKAEWVQVVKGKVLDTSPLWAFVDECGHTIIQIPSKKYPQKFLEHLQNRKI